MAERVLLIGNGPAALSRRAGAQIDAFDGVVARFNEYHIAGYEESVGTRTDEWITWALFENRASVDYPRVLYSLPPPRKTLDAVRARYPHLRMIEDETFAQTRERMNYELPSSGAYSAMHYVRSGVEVVLYGFDFFQGPKHHYGDEGEQGYRHSPHYEALFFRGLMREGKVSVLGEKDRAAAARAEPAAGMDESDPIWQRDEYKRVAALRLAEIDRIQVELDSAWAKYEELARSWKELDAGNRELRGHVHNLIAEKASLYEQHQEQERRLVELYARADALEQEKAAVGRSWQELAARNEDLQGHFNRVTAEKDSLAAELGRRWEEHRVLEARLAKASEDAAAQKLAREQTMTQLDLFGREAAAAKAMLAAANAAREQTERERSRLAAELERMQREAAEVRRDLDSLRDAVRQLRQRRVYGLLARSRLLPDRIESPQAAGPHVDG